MTDLQFGDSYTQGLASTDDASPANPRRIVGNGTLWSTTALAGDLFWCQGLSVPIASVVNDTELLLREDWPGEVFSDSAYSIEFLSGLRHTPTELAGRVRDLINRLRVFDAASPLFSIKTFAVNTPPVDAVEKDRYVVGAAGTGAFSGHNNEIAEKTETGWLFYIPAHGWHVIDEANNFVRLWNGSMWTSAAGLGASIIFIGPWDNVTDYDPGNVVIHNDRAWIATTESTDSEPDFDSDDWSIFLDLGVDGGAFTLRYQFSTDNANSDPGSGHVKLNASPGTATILRINKTDVHGTDWTSLITGIGTSTTSTQKGKLRIVTKGDLTRQWIATVMSVSAVGDYFNLTVSSPVESINALQDGAEVLFIFQERGDVGLQGIQGNQGVRGFAGGQSINFVIDTTTTTDSDPGNGKLRLNAATQNETTVIRADNQSATGGDVMSLLTSIGSASTSTVKASARLFLSSNPDVYLAFNVTAVATPSGYRNITIAVTGQSDANPFTNGDVVTFTWTPKGDKGDTGDQGDPGAQGDPFQFYAIVPDLDGRDDYDDAAEGSLVLVEADDDHSGNAWVYAKASASSGDWDDGFAFVGAAVSGIPTVAVSAPTNVGSAEKGKLLDCSAAVTLTLAAAATLGTNWYAYVKARGGTVTLAFDGSEALDGFTTIKIPDGQAMLVTCNGTSLRGMRSHTAYGIGIEADLALASTVDLGSLDTDRIRITTGTGPVTSFGTAKNRKRICRAAVDFTITHNATTLDLGDASINVKTGDIFEVASDVSGNWRLQWYRKANNQAVRSRAVLVGNVTYYVRTDGSDSNDGLTNTSGGAFLTIQKALNTVLGTLDLSGYNATIQVADGTYTGAVNMDSAQVGKGQITLKGNTSTPGNVIVSVTSNHAIQTSAPGAKLRVQDMELRTTTSGNCITVTNLSFVEFGNIRFGACAGCHMFVSNLSVLASMSDWFIVGAAATHVWFLAHAIVLLDFRGCTLTGYFHFADSLGNTQVFMLGWTGGKMNVYMPNSGGMGWKDSNGKTRQTTTGNTHSNTTLDNLGINTSNLAVGMFVVGSGIAAGTTIASILSSSSVQLSGAAGSSLTGTSIKFELARAIKFDLSLNSAINTVGLGVDLLPGTLAGNVGTTGGQYA